MNEPTVKPELILKALIIDWLLKKSPSSEIACEVAFADKRRRADIVQIKKDQLHAYEVKSASDNLNKLQAQLKDYSASFDFLTIVCEEKHLMAIQRNVPTSVGILLIKENHIIIIRCPTKRKRLSKKKLLSLIGKQALTKIASENGIHRASSNSIDCLRNNLCKALTLNKIHSATVQYIKSKHSPSFNAFLSEKSEKTNIEDILLLSGSYSQVREN